MYESHMCPSRERKMGLSYNSANRGIHKLCQTGHSATSMPSFAMVVIVVVDVNPVPVPVLCGRCRHCCRWRSGAFASFMMVCRNSNQGPATAAAITTYTLTNSPVISGSSDMDQHNVQHTNPVENEHDVPSSTKNDERDDPGAYPVPFRIPGKIVPGCRLDSIPDALRYWARDAERNTSPWYEDFLEADDRYETFLSERRAPGDYIVTFGKHKGKKLRELPVSYRYWAILPDHSSSGWVSSHFCKR
ncbi:hypothetical protein F5I97DRAFT_1982744 [Phlebopus sp. FC_14]|nr:hypothetical protein F5I97DRAFT_1982744 [Phlebopus sp. FC_14]